MAVPIRYTAPTSRTLVWLFGLAALVGAAVVMGSGLRSANASAAPAPSSRVRYESEVYVQNPSRGCRWQYTNDANVQTAECGDENENVRIVFHKGQVTEYRIVVRAESPGPTPAPDPLAALLGGKGSSPHRP